MYPMKTREYPYSEVRYIVSQLTWYLPQKCAAATVVKLIGNESAKRQTTAAAWQYMHSKLPGTPCILAIYFTSTTVYK